MPYSINGIGTKYYGNRDKATDGSYVTTEFIAFIFVPIIPLRSFRVVASSPAQWKFMGTSQKFQAVRIAMNWRQVLNVYLVPVCIFAALIAFGTFYGKLK